MRAQKHKQKINKIQGRKRFHYIKDIADINSQSLDTKVGNSLAVNLTNFAAFYSASTILLNSLRNQLQKLLKLLQLKSSLV